MMDQQRARLQQQVLIINELLRHFWASVPFSTASQEHKAKRMTDQLQARKTAIADLLSHNQNSGKLSVAAHAIMRSVQAAHMRFKLEVTKCRTSQHARLMAA